MDWKDYQIANGWSSRIVYSRNESRTMVTLQNSFIDHSVWFEWIDSHSNPADGLSRLGLKDPWTLKQGWTLQEVSDTSWDTLFKTFAIGSPPILGLGEGQTTPHPKGLEASEAWRRPHIIYMVWHKPFSLLTRYTPYMSDDVGKHIYDVGGALP